MFIRPVLPGDAPELAYAIRTADPDTLRRRFLGGPPRVTAALLEHLTVVDYVQRFALVAIDTVIERGIAEFSLTLDCPEPGTGPAGKAAGGLAGQHQEL